MKQIGFLMIGACLFAEEQAVAEPAEEITTLHAEVAQEESVVAEEAAPLEEAPVAQEEVVAEPAQEEAPVAQEEVAAEPAQEEAPVVQEEVAAEPAQEEAPVVQEEVAAEPAQEEAPVAQEVAAAEPAQEEAPVAQEVAAVEPAQEEAPVAQEEVAAEPAQEEAPVAQEEVVAEPAQEEAPVAKEEAPVAGEITNTGPVVSAEVELEVAQEEVASEEVVALQEEVLETPEVAPAVMEVQKQAIRYMSGEQLILDNGFVLQVEDASCLQLFAKGDLLTIEEGEDEYCIQHDLTRLEIKCKLCGTTDGEVLFVGKVVHDLVELSNGDLYVALESGAEWKVKRSLLQIETENGDVLYDVASGASRSVRYIGELEQKRSLDIILNNEGNQLVLANAGELRWAAEELEECNIWESGDEVIVQSFNKLDTPPFASQLPFMFLHNVTKNETAIAMSVAN